MPRRLRTQLAVAIALVTAIGVGASFVALYTGTGSRLRAQIDAQLLTQSAEWRQFSAGRDTSTPKALARVARGFIAAQRYHAESLIILVQVRHGPTVTNSPDVVAAEDARDRRRHELGGLFGAPGGLSTQTVAEAGSMRVLTEAVRSGAQQVGTARFANPLTPVSQQQASLRRTFLIVGLAALALAIAAGVGLASLIAAPLRRMAGVAAAVDSGDLSVRAAPITAPTEVRVLASAFNNMLDRLERTFKRQRDFVSDASHELRTPLAVLRAQVELLDRESDPGARHQGTLTLLRRLDELDRLVGDMLTLASAEAGHLVEPEEINLEDFFEDLRRDLPLFGDRDYHLEAVDGTLHADPDRLTQVLRNLVRNAVAHTSAGGRIDVVARSRGDMLQISISDSGAGIPGEELERIFERFHRADQGRSRDRGGSGLGLAIARAIVEAHGGRIRAESPPGQGATFWIELPGYRTTYVQPRKQPQPHL